MPFTAIQVAHAAHALGMIALTPIWAFLSDKYGNRPLLFVQIFGLTLTPVMYLFCNPGQDVSNIAILIGGHLFSGAVWGGVALCQLNLLFATARAEDRANYIGVGMAVQALVGGIAPLIGAEIMEALRALYAAADAYKGLFLATMGARFASLFFLLPVREPGSVRIRETLRHLRKVTPKGYAALRSMSKSTSPVGRERAIRAVGSQQMTLAVDEIIGALHDPSPRVRREAATALARIGDEKAVGALIHQLDEHPNLVEEETVMALGVLGSPEAVEPLIRLMRSPRAVLRRAAARALGRLGDASAVPPLLAGAEQAGDPDLRRACLQALRLIGAQEAESVVGDALFDPDPSVRIAAAEAVSELGIDSALPYVRQSLNYYEDEAESEIAYALGAIGTLQDVPIILRHAQSCVSIITRRRCLLGVARLLGVEPEVYRLLSTEGMARDSALVELLGPLARRSKRTRAAMELFASSREPEALVALASARNVPELSTLAATPVDEAFLVASAWLTKRPSGALRRPS
jgi:HEAT repeat protein